MRERVAWGIVLVEFIIIMILKQCNPSEVYVDRWHTEYKTLPAETLYVDKIMYKDRIITKKVYLKARDEFKRDVFDSMSDDQKLDTTFAFYQHRFTDQVFDDDTLQATVSTTVFRNDVVDSQLKYRIKNIPSQPKKNQLMVGVNGFGNQEKIYTFAELTFVNKKGTYVSGAYDPFNKMVGFGFGLKLK